MIILLVFSFLLFLLARRVLLKQRLNGMVLKPYRYPLETRRSPWSNRLGF